MKFDQPMNIDSKLTQRCVAVGFPIMIVAAEQHFI